MKRTIFDFTKNTPRQLMVCIYDAPKHGKSVGDWLFAEYNDMRISMMDAPESIPCGSTKFHLSYVENETEFGTPIETLRHREGWY